MSKKRDDLKERLKALRVNEPLKLNGEMKPPMERKEVPHPEAPPILAPQIEKARIERAQSESSPCFESQKHTIANSEFEVTKFESAQIVHTRTEPPQHENAPSKAPLNKPAKIEIAENVRAQNEMPRNAHAQKEVPQNEVASEQPPQSEMTGGELFEPRNNQGFFKLSHAVFSEPLLQQLSGDCFRLFLWLSSRAWRFSKSNGQLRASVRFIEDQTGMSHATVSRALKTLKEKGLVRLVEVDFKRGNIWQVSALALGARGPEDTPPSGERPQSEVTQFESTAPSKRGASNLKFSTKVPQNECNIRSSNNQKDLKKETPHVLVSDGKETDAELEAWENAVDSFETEVSANEKTVLIQQFTEQAFPHGFLPPSSVIRKMAALAWYRRTHVHSSKIAI